MWKLLLPLEFQILNAPFPGNSTVNPPPALEIPRFLNRGVGADNNWNSPIYDLVLKNSSNIHNFTCRN
jgi:hypothetical protein